MATFYSVWGPTYNAYRCYISESRSQNITNNTSTVSVTSYFETRAGWGIEDANTHVRARVRGSNVIDKTYNLSVGVNTSKNIGSGSRTLSHNADGTLSNSTVELLVNTRNTGLFNNTASGSISHPTIPRATTPSSGNFTTGSATSISLPRASSSFTHEVTYKVGSATGTISSSAGTTASWTPAHSLGEQFKNATSATVTITVKTKNGSTTIGTKTMNKTLTLASSQVPSVSSVTFTDQNSTIVSNIGAYVQGKSELKATISGSGIHGSTIPAGDDKRRVTIDGITYNQGAIIPLPSSGARDYTGRITDSRGRQGTLSGSINVLPYTEPQFVNVHAYRSATASGTESNDGEYLRIQLQTQVQSLVVGTQKNWHSIQVRTRPNGGAWTSRNTIANAGLSYNSTINVSGGAIFSDTTSYDVEITIVDRVGVAVQYTERVSTAIPALDMHGTSVGISKMHEQGALDVGGDGYFSGLLDVGGGIYAGGDIHSSGMYHGGLAPSQVYDWDAAIVPGRYFCDNLALNGPTNGYYVGTVTAYGTDLERVIQEVSVAGHSATNVARTFRRVSNVGITSWSEWTPITHSEIWTRYAYAPDNTGTLPTSEASAMIVVSGDIPVKPYDQIVMGHFTANFGGSSSSGNHLFCAGVQFFATGTSPARDSHHHAQVIRNDTSTTNITINMPFFNLVPAGTASSYRMLQWGNTSGYSVTDGNGLAFYILAMGT